MHSDEILEKKIKKSPKSTPVSCMETDFPELFVRLLGWGLTKYEASVYLYLLRKSAPTGGSKIAVGAKLHRPYVYAALPRLIAMSLVVEVAHGKQSKYKAMPPSQLEKLEMKRAVETTELTEALKKISKVAYEQDAELFIGREAIIKHQLEWVRGAPQKMTQYLLGGSGKAMRELLGENLEENTRLQGIKKFTTYYLCSPEEKEIFGEYHTSGVALHLRSLSIIPEMFPTIAIRGDVVELHSYFNPPIMHMIKSKEVAEKFKTFFLGLWELAGEGK
ncbi:MAG: helix-turn-helix domain-containing protein [Minisyncoccia bacterium]